LEAGNLAQPHQFKNSQMEEIDFWKSNLNGAAGGVYTNANDLCQWMFVNLQYGHYGEKMEKQLYSEQRQQEIWNIHTVKEPNPFPRYSNHFSGYGLGWYVSDLKGNLLAEHTGAIPGMISKIVLIPDLQFGIVCLTNTANEGAGFNEAFTMTIIDKLLGLDDFRWTDRYAYQYKMQSTTEDTTTKAVWNKVEQNQNVKINFKKYLGTYNDPWFGDFIVSKSNNRLWIKSVRSPKLNGELQYYHKNTFAVKWEYQLNNADALITFNKSVNEEFNSISLKGISPFLDFSFDFQDLKPIKQK
jgi:hypothetical protein